jgi:hypothetical protein
MSTGQVNGGPPPTAEQARRVGKFRVTLHLLEQLLHLPEDHHIRAVRGVDNGLDYLLEVLVEGPTLPESPINDEHPPEARFSVSVEENKRLVRERKYSGKFERA